MTISFQRVNLLSPPKQAFCFDPKINFNVNFIAVGSKSTDLNKGLPGPHYLFNSLKVKVVKTSGQDVGNNYRGQATKRDRKLNCHHSATISPLDEINFIIGL